MNDQGSKIKVLDEKICDRTSHSSYCSYCNLLVLHLPISASSLISLISLISQPLTVLKIVPTNIERNEIKKICCIRVNENFSRPRTFVLDFKMKHTFMHIHQSS